MTTTQQGKLTEVSELLRIWQTWLGSCRDNCDEEGQKLWDRIDAARAIEAEVEARTAKKMEALVEALKEHDRFADSVKGCTNHGCLIHPPAPGMMGTNAMCSCYRDGMKAQRMMYAGQQLAKKLREALAAHQQDTVAEKGEK